MGLMQQFQSRQPQSNSLSAILAMTNGNPQSLMAQLMRNNSDFAMFVEQNKNKTPEQAFRDNGFDYSQFKHLFH